MFKSLNDFIQRIRMIFYALIGVPLTGFLVLYLRYKEGGEIPPSVELIDVFQFVVPMICIFDTVAGYVIYSKKIKEIREMKGGLKEKLPAFFQISLVKFAVLTGGSLFAVVAYYLTGHPMIAVTYLLMLVMMAMSNPSTYNILNELKLPKAEEELFHNGRLE